MMLGIIAAMSEELSDLIKIMKIDRSEKKAKMIFNSGYIWNKEVVLVVCGIGKVNAAICVQILADDFKVDKVINIGIAGGLFEKIVPGDIVIADSLVQHDMDTSFLGDKIGQIPRIDTFDFKSDKTLLKLANDAAEEMIKIGDFKSKIYIGRIATGDQFVADKKKMMWLSYTFDAKACEMEGGSIAQVCYLNNIPFIVIRSISDNALNDSHLDYDKFVPIAVKNSHLILEKMIKNV